MRLIFITYDKIKKSKRVLNILRVKSATATNIRSIEVGQRPGREGTRGVNLLLACSL